MTTTERVNIWCRYVAKCGEAEAAGRVCAECAAWRELCALRDLWVSLHMWGDIGGATELAKGLIKAMSGSSENGRTHVWNQAMNYVHGPIGGIHPSHPAEYHERVMNEYREGAMRRIANAVLL